MPIFKKIVSRSLFTKFERLNLVRKCSYVFNMSDTAVQAYLKNILSEHDHLNVKTIRSPDESKRLFEIKPIVNKLEQRINLHDNIETLSKRQDDEDENIEMIKIEARSYLKRMSDVDRELQAMLLEPQFTEGGVLLEVTAGAGGQDAMLFARQLFEMYESYAKYKDWDVRIVAIAKSENEGISKASMFVEGVGAPELMKMESGVHRVQKIPDYEEDGQIHTSTVLVTVLPKPSNIEAKIRSEDIFIETKRTNEDDGPQADTAGVRVTHTPTGLVVECQEGSSQSENQELAIQKLRTLLLEKQQQEHISANNSERESENIWTDKNEYIRTYSYAKERVTEHREGGGVIRNLEGFMEGDYLLEQMQHNLLRVHRRHELMEEIRNFNEKMDMKSADMN